jgi:hypothetical protein
MGKSHRPWHRRLFHVSILERLSRESEGTDLMIVDI